VCEYSFTHSRVAGVKLAAPWPGVRLPPHAPQAIDQPKWPNEIRNRGRTYVVVCRCRKSCLDLSTFHFAMDRDVISETGLERSRAARALPDRVLVSSVARSLGRRWLPRKPKFVGDLSPKRVDDCGYCQVNFSKLEDPIYPVTSRGDRVCPRRKGALTQFPIMASAGQSRPRLKGCIRPHVR
jgi:hypothetical protein